MSHIDNPPLHPGEALAEDFLIEFGMSAEDLAERAQIPIERIEALLAEEEDFSVDDAVRISSVLGTSPDFWLHLQTSYTKWALSAEFAVAN